MKGIVRTVVSEVCSFIENTLNTSSETEVADLNSTVIVYKYICRLEVSMNDLRLVKVVQSAKNIIDDRLNLHFLKVLR